MIGSLIHRAVAASLVAAGIAVLTLPAQAVPVTRTSSFAYDATTGLLTQEVIEPDQTAYRLQTVYTHDAFGNRLSSTVSGTGITTRSSSNTYDAQGRFTVTSTNALSQQGSTAYSAAFGVITSVTDPNNLTGSTQYDSLGRKTLVIGPDGNRVKFEYLYCSGVNGGTFACPAGGAGAAYALRQTHLASDGTTQTGPITVQYFDRMQREIATDGQAFDGTYVRKETQYDAQGRVYRVARPHASTTAASLWSVTYTYDTLGRPTVETAADSSTVLHAYQGLKTVDTNGLSQTKTTVLNSQGKVASVTDNLGNTTKYAYDAFNNLLSTTDSLNNASSATYDIRGRKITSSDPDMGAWSYTYNVLDQLVTQTDAKMQVTTITYDLMGRMTKRVEPGLTSNWYYDQQTGGIGKLNKWTTSAGFQRDVDFDDFGRPFYSGETIDGVIYHWSTYYDSLGRISRVSPPSGANIIYTYTTGTGFLKQISNLNDGDVYWKADSYNADGSLTQETLGNGVVTTNTYDPNTGRLTGIQAGPSNGVQNQTFQYDVLGNLKVRTEGIYNVTDTLTYDGLNRLTQVVTTRPSQTTITKTTAYDAIGNITSKSDVGIYTYNATRKHAVASTSGTVNTTYAYDNNGNMTSGGGRTITWTAFNKAQQITQGSNTLTLTYDGDHDRIKQVSSNGSTTYYLFDPNSGQRTEKLVGSTGTVTYTDYLMAGGNLVALIKSDATQSIFQVRYTHTDHQGSVMAVTNLTGAVVERDSFDAWGKRRNVTGQDDASFPSTSIVSMTTRGFTNQEQMDSVGLINFNGRIYDPLIGRFISADPYIQDQTDSQSLNRYSYVSNNPLTLTDPSGYFSLGKFFKKLWKSIKKAINWAWNWIKTNYATLVQLAVTLVLTPYIGPVGAAFIGGFAAGMISSHGNLKSALMGAAMSAAQAGASFLLSSAVSFIQSAMPTALGNGLAVAANVAGRAAIGCASEAASGGECGPAALASGAGTLATWGAGQVELDFSSGMAVSAASGGVAAVLGGGKFANGAMTGAFAYLAEKGAEKLRPVKDFVFGPSAPTLSHGTGGKAFVGDFLDYWTNGPTLQAYTKYVAAGGSAAYFTWDQGADLATWLDANAKNVTEVIGHGYGGDTAAAAFAHGHGSGATLTTVDPVSWLRPSYGAVARTARSWVSYNATGGGNSFGNIFAGVGGAWNNGPSNPAYVGAVPLDHRNTMCYVGLNQSAC